MNIGTFLLLQWITISEWLCCDHGGRRGFTEGASLSLALRYLQKFGYLDHDTQGGLAAQLHRDDFIGAIRTFQGFSGLQVTGKMDATTVKRMKLPRCGNPDPVHRDPRSRAFILQGSKWDKLDLTFKIGQYSRTLSRKAVDEIIGKAFSYWSKPSGLTFTQVDSGAADIVILFARGEHGDLSPFDGPQGVLAHAFFPDFGGDTHFDDSERWTQSARNGVNLLQVAVHELGHALGLDHSDVAAAVMAPFYDGFNPKFELHTDDIAGIRRLYPLREGTTGATESSVNFEVEEVNSEPLTTTPMAPSTRPFPTRPPFRTRYSSSRSTASSHTIPPETTPSTSTTELPFPTMNPETTTTTTATTTTDPPTRRRATTPLFYNVNEAETLEETEEPTKNPFPPILTSELPTTTPISTTTKRKSPRTTSTVTRTSTSLVNKTEVFIFTKASPEGASPEEVSEAATATTSTVKPTKIRPTTPVTTVTTVTMVGHPQTDTTNRTARVADYPDLCDPKFVIDAVTTCEGIGYLFSGDYYWMMSAMGEVLLPGRPISAEWGGLPGNLDAALTPSWAGGRTYFLKGSWYWRVTDRKIDTGYPKLIRASWGGVPDEIDAAFQWGKNSRTYFAKGKQLWSFDRTKMPPVRGPRPVPVDRGFPQQIDAGFRSSNGRTYLFSKDKYYAMSTWSFLISRYYPQPTGPRWFGCGALLEQPTDHMALDPAIHRDVDFGLDIPGNRTFSSSSMSALHLSLYPMP
ncbi:putative Interstitial collagenase [Hypsibius exemplaris]|uniref:Interstitial collagenase n=1 Tax=Hypsibius exemplaris TaxID=2072580 RepID=A0A9X6NJA2_HYPEX|nr:putative Interstitial collagenase [Hypsibius exemplaris]